MGSMLLTVVIVLLIPLAALAILAGLVVAVFRILGGNTSRYLRGHREEETRLIQEIHQGLSKMEKRIEALETILMDADRKERDEHQG